VDRLDSEPEPRSGARARTCTFALTRGSVRFKRKVFSCNGLDVTITQNRSTDPRPIHARMQTHATDDRRAGIPPANARHERQKGGHSSCEKTSTLNVMLSAFAGLLLLALFIRVQEGFLIGSRPKLVSAVLTRLSSVLRRQRPDAAAGAALPQSVSNLRGQPGSAAAANLNLTAAANSTAAAGVAAARTPPPESVPAGRSVSPPSQVRRGASQPQQARSGAASSESGIKCSALLNLATTFIDDTRDPLKIAAQDNVLQAYHRLREAGGFQGFLFTKSEAWAKKARTKGVVVVSDVATNPHGTPKFKDMIIKVQELTLKHCGAPKDIVFDGYANGDIIFTSGLIDTLAMVRGGWQKAVQQGTKKGVMLVGRRTNVHFAGDTLSSDQRVAELASKSGTLFAADAEDYFIYSRGAEDWAHLPEFVVGRVGYDNWLVDHAYHDPQVDLIDATATVLAVHLTAKVRAARVRSCSACVRAARACALVSRHALVCVLLSLSRVAPSQPQQVLAAICMHVRMRATVSHARTDTLINQPSGLCVFARARARVWVWVGGWVVGWVVGWMCVCVRARARGRACVRAFKRLARKWVILFFCPGWQQGWAQEGG